MSNKMTVYFKDFLREIRLTEHQIEELRSAHSTLRDRLMNDEELSKIIETTFLQGSYRRATAVRPKNGKRSDVDIIVVTNLDKDNVTAEEALSLFENFLEKYYSGKYRLQGRSWGIEMTHVDLDLVPTSAPSISQGELFNNVVLLSDDDIEEMSMIAERLSEDFTKKSWYSDYVELFESNKEAEWKEEPLYIPDREADLWEKTHPLEQINWTQQKNSKCNGHYVNVVKCLKWWRKEKHPDVKHPKSYPLEHFIGECCPDGIDSVAEGITLTLENIVNGYPEKPFLSDRGVPEHDVFAKLSDEDYESFYESVCDAAIIARKAYEAETVEESANYWRELFGNKYPIPEKETNSVFTERETVSSVSGGRFA